MKTIFYEVEKGRHILGACTKAVRIAKRWKCQVKFCFNDVILVADPKSTVRELGLEWELKRVIDHNTHLTS